MTTPEAIARVADIKTQFVKAMAAYLVSNIAEKSIFLQMGKPDARAWAAAYQAAGCQGWATQEEAEEAIRRILAL